MKVLESPHSLASPNRYMNCHISTTAILGKPFISVAVTLTTTQCLAKGDLLRVGARAAESVRMSDSYLCIVFA
jgi:hypothetical protein